MNKTCLLITCALNVSHTPLMVLTDPETRRIQTATALEKWINHKDVFGIDKIVLVESTNSGDTVFGELQRRNDEFLEVLSFDGQNEVLSRGKGYGELNACEYALKSSRFIPLCSRFMKIGARYFIPNYNQVLDHDNIDSYIFCSFSARLRRVAALFFGGSIELLQDMSLHKDMLDERTGFEHENFIAYLALRAHVSGKKCTHIVTPPVILGQSGTSGYQRTNSKRAIYTQKLRNIAYSKILDWQ